MVTENSFRSTSTFAAASPSPAGSASPFLWSAGGLRRIARGRRRVGCRGNAEVGHHAFHGDHDHDQAEDQDLAQHRSLGRRGRTAASSFFGGGDVLAMVSLVGFSGRSLNSKLSFLSMPGAVRKKSLLLRFPGRPFIPFVTFLWLMAFRARQPMAWPDACPARCRWLTCLRRCAVGRHQVLRLLVDHGPPQHLVHRLGHHQPLAGRERDERVGPGLDVLDQLGVEDERFASQVG